MKLVITLLFAAPLYLLAQTKQKQAVKSKAKPMVAKKVVATEVNGPFRLVVAAKGYKDSTLALIVNPANQEYRGPFGYVKNEKITLSGTLPQDDMYLLVMTDGKVQANNKYYNAFLVNDDYEVNIDKSTNNLQVVKGNSLLAFDKLLTAFGAEFDALSQLSQDKQNLQAQGKAFDTLDQKMNVLKQAIKEKIPGFLKTNATSPVAAYLLYTTKPILSIGEVEENLKLLDEAQQNTGYGAALNEFVQTEKTTGEGQVAANFTQNDVNGKPVSLSDFKGKYVLVDFWASWCGPCRQENPNVVSAYNTYKNKNFTVLGVSLDRDKAKWLQAINDDQLAWTQVSDLKYWQNAVAQQFKITSIPQNLLIGPDGKIIAKNLRGGVLQSYLEQTLK